MSALVRAKKKAVFVLLRQPARGGDLFATIASVKHRGALSLPGGKVERGEGWKRAARRECREEIGLEPGDLREIWHGDRGPYDVKVFVSEIEKGQSTRMQSSPEGEAMWVPRAELVTGRFESFYAELMDRAGF